jgi:hypothetical protein
MPSSKANRLAMIDAAQDAMDKGSRDATAVAASAKDHATTTVARVATVARVDLAETAVRAVTATNAAATGVTNAPSRRAPNFRRFSLQKSTSKSFRPNLLQKPLPNKSEPAAKLTRFIALHGYSSTSPSVTKFESHQKVTTIRSSKSKTARSALIAT